MKKLTKRQLTDIHEVYTPEMSKEVIRILPILNTYIDTYPDILPAFRDAMLWQKFDLYAEAMIKLNHMPLTDKRLYKIRDELKINWAPIAVECFNDWAVKNKMHIVLKYHKEHNHRVSTFDYTEIVIRKTHILSPIVVMACVYDYNYVSLDTYPPVLEDGMYRWGELAIYNIQTELQALLNHIRIKEVS